VEHCWGLSARRRRRQADNMAEPIEVMDDVRNGIDGDSHERRTDIEHFANRDVARVAHGPPGTQLEPAGRIQFARASGAPSPPALVSPPAGLPSSEPNSSFFLLELSREAARIELRQSKVAISTAACPLLQPGANRRADALGRSLEMSSRFISLAALGLATGACTAPTPSTPVSTEAAAQQLESGFIDKEENVTKISPLVQSLTAQATHAVDVLSKVKSGVDAAKTVLQFLGYLPPDDAAQQALFAELRQQVEDLGIALGELETAPARDQRLSDMRSYVNIIKKDLAISGGEAINQSLLSPAEVVELGGAMEDSQTAAQSGGNPSAFLRPFGEQLTDGDWKKLIGNRPGCVKGVGSCTINFITDKKLIFDWRLGLPDFVRLIASRLAIIAATSADFKTTGFLAEEFQQYRTRLGELYDQMKTGIQCASNRALLTDVVCADVYSGVAMSTQLNEPACNIGGSLVCQSRIDDANARLTREVMSKLPLYKMRNMIDALSVLMDQDSDLANLHRIRLRTEGGPMCLSQRFVGVWADNPDDPYNPILQGDLWGTSVVGCTGDPNQNFTYDRESGHISNDSGACLTPSRFDLGEGVVVKPCTGDAGELWSYDPVTGVLENGSHSVLAGPPAPFLSSAPRTEVRGTGSLQSWQPYAIPRPTRSLLWRNVNSGELSAWLLDLSGNVTGTRELSRRCTAEDGCASRKVIGTLDLNQDGNFDVLWHDTSTGQVSAWLLDEQGTVLGQRVLSWGCGPACAQDWTAIATLDVNRDEHTDLVWQNVGTGEISAWLLDNHGTVIGAQSLSMGCDEGCARTRSAVAALDANGDGNMDLLWHDTNHGDLTAWLLDHGRVTSTSSLSRLCGAGDGCSQSWRVVGAADLNGDSTGDVLFYNAETGQLSTWLTDGNGTVIGEQSLSWRCDTPSGCAAAWQPVGLISVR
jgi:hypothetical protein